MTSFGGAGGSFGPNAWLVDDMYEQYRVDPESVSESWREFFADYVPGAVPVPPPMSASSTSASAIGPAGCAAT